MEGPARPAAAAAYRLLVAQSLAAERVLDALLQPLPVHHSLLADVTVLVKTFFERPHILGRLVRSIGRFYPDVRIVAVDDSRQPRPLAGVETVVMPFDSGIAAGRNEGLRHVETRYVLVIDDDCVFYRRTRLVPALSLMERYPRIDIMGGQLVDLPFRHRRPLRWTQGLFETARKPVIPFGSTIGGLLVCPRVSNFFLARRARLQLVGWDPALKRVEHTDFFTRAVGVLVTVYNPSLRCLHARTPFDRSYMAHRLKVRDAREYLARRYGPSPPGRSPSKLP